MWVDVLAITKEASKDPKKMEAYYLLAGYLTGPDSQDMFRQQLRALPLTVAGEMDLPVFDSRFFWRPMDNKTSDGLLALWNDVIKGK